MFWAHGSYEVKKEGQILLVDACGPFNRETIFSLDKDLISFVGQLRHAPWAEIATLKNESAYTPEALEELAKSFQDRVRNNLIAIAILFKDIESRTLSEYQLTSIFKQCDGLDWLFCESIESARDWCNRALSNYQENM
ncbi:hypothetical protein [Alteromonas ponticola]|uniref:STAS/SEC14 domain-containing protein n=1 Tax=Alteromonas ponticola TaxID=2720613 RepID=A0ABX1QY60_9ALTE|nr:hypothetical protein [Alteromonas ponticola]NMH59175.1 hypothetical protein [Alteromonas ponticola]